MWKSCNDTLSPPPPFAPALLPGIALQTAVRGGSGGGKRKGKEAPPKKKRGREGKAGGERARAALGFYELNDEEDAATAAVGLGSARDKQAQAQRRRYVLVHWRLPKVCFSSFYVCVA